MAQPIPKAGLRNTEAQQLATNPPCRIGGVGVAMFISMPSFIHPFTYILGVQFFSKKKRGLDQTSSLLPP